MKKIGRRLQNAHPGIILLEQFIKPLKITQYRVSKEIGVPQRRIRELIRGNRGISPDTGLRLAKFFGQPDDYWLKLQVDYDVATTKPQIREWLGYIKPWKPLPKGKR